jgi:hypothetical protein
MTSRKLYWGLMEHRAVIDLLKRMGFDGVTVNERGAYEDHYNIGVFNTGSIRIAGTERIQRSFYDELVVKGLIGR